VYKDKEKYSDFVKFIDDDGEPKEWFVKVVKISGSFLSFETMDGNLISIPSHQVIKVKQKGGEHNGLNPYQQ